MANNNDNDKTIKRVAGGTAVATVATLLVAKHGAEVYSDEFKNIMNDLKYELSTIKGNNILLSNGTYLDVATATRDSNGNWDYNNSSVQPTNDNKFPLAGSEAKEGGLSFDKFLGTPSTTENGNDLGYYGKTIKDAFVIKDSNGNLVGYYYKDEGSTEYKLFINGKEYTATGTTDESGKLTLKFQTPDPATTSSTRQSELIVDSDMNVTSNNLNGFKGTVSQTDITVYNAYNTSTSKFNRVIGFVDEKTGQGYFNDAVNGFTPGNVSVTEDIIGLKDFYISKIQEGIKNGTLSEEAGEELKKMISEVTSVRDLSSCNNAIANKFNDPNFKLSNDFSKGFEHMREVFDNSSIVKGVNDFLGDDIITSGHIITLSVVAGLVAIGGAVIKNQDNIKKGIDKTKKLVLSVPSLLSNKQSDNTRSK